MAVQVAFATKYWTPDLMLFNNSSLAGTRKPHFRQGILHPDICVVGAGSGGLSVAAVAVQVGASVVIIEQGKMGGDCLNTGCVPSKALIAAAHAAQTMRSLLTMSRFTRIQGSGAP